jgi:hypothetical protein
MVQKFIVEKSGVEKFMVEKSGFERSGVEVVVEKSGVEISFNLHRHRNLAIDTHHAYMHFLRNKSERKLRSKVPMCRENF